MIDLDGVELPTLSDGRLVVRPYRPDDVAAVQAMRDDPEAAHWSRIPSPFTRELAETWVADADRRWRDERFATFLVCEAAGGEAIGSIHVSVDEERQSGHVGYLTAVEARGRGVATAALRLLVAWCFDDLGLGRLQARTDLDNRRSQRVLERCGFSPEGVLRGYSFVRGVRVDEVMFSLLPVDPR